MTFLNLLRYLLLTILFIKAILCYNILYKLSLIYSSYFSFIYWKLNYQLVSCHLMLYKSISQKSFLLQNPRQAMVNHVFQLLVSTARCRNITRNQSLCLVLSWFLYCSDSITPLYCSLFTVIESQIAKING